MTIIKNILRNIFKGFFAVCLFFATALAVILKLEKGEKRNGYKKIGNIDEARVIGDRLSDKYGRGRS
ncbi:hypothetical protein NO1_0265 [Candidatus Termititenax aidoneus]|uniref:Uncharacterized protein n=1 Tax=Termititenax aidoneus TaxID=2218524 RepID=A0A388TAQ7_TERA1|nr:hypothetical protein NO1_0265 [Candidatus Termititenax aidoneus]